MIIDGIVPGLNYAADSAGEMSVAERRTPKKRRDAASPSQSSWCNHGENEASVHR